MSISVNQFDAGRTRSKSSAWSWNELPHGDLAVRIKSTSNGFRSKTMILALHNDKLLMSPRGIHYGAENATRIF